MNLKQYLNAKQQRLASGTLYFPDNNAVTDFDYPKLAKEAYKKNPYYFGAVRIISTLFSMLRPTAQTLEDGEWVDLPEQHPANEIFVRPNDDDGWSYFGTAACSYFLMSGKCFERILAPESGPNQSRPQQLVNIQPDQLDVKSGGDTEPISYFQFKGRRGERIDKQDMIYVRSFDPENPADGHSPGMSGQYAIDAMNQFQKWNLNMTRNGGIPPVWIKMVGNNEGTAQGILETWRQKQSGAKNAGEPFVSNSGIDSIEVLGDKMSDIDWAEGIVTFGRLILMTIGVPPEVLGDSQNKTYSNYKEARKALWTEVVLPIWSLFLDQYNHSLASRFDDNIRYTIDKDQIDVLKDERDKMHEMARTDFETGLLTLNEAREMAGFENIEGGDFRVLKSTLIPVDMGMPDEELGKMIKAKVMSSGESKPK